MTKVDATGITAQEDSIFKAQWELYQAVLDGDHLEHTKLYINLVKYLHCHLQSSWTALDLGCGDAFYVSKLLRESQLGKSLRHYVGVDMSRAALTYADRFLHEALPAEAQVELVESEMLQYCESCTQQYDVVMSSYAVHHLSVPNKQRLLAAVARLLKPGGCFLLVDVFRAEGQSREAYMEDYMVHVDQDWTQLEPSQRASVKHHVSNFDFPETLSEYRSWADACGSYAGVRPLCEVKFGKLVVFATS